YFFACQGLLKRRVGFRAGYVGLIYEAVPEGRAQALKILGHNGIMMMGMRCFALLHQTAYQQGGSGALIDNQADETFRACCRDQGTEFTKCRSDISRCLQGYAA